MKQNARQGFPRTGMAEVASNAMRTAKPEAPSAPRENLRPTDLEGRVSGKNYTLGDELGKGSFGCVRKARDEAADRNVAIKVFRKALMTDPKEANRVYNEVALHSRLAHPSVVEVLGRFEDDSHLYLVLEHCEHGSLADYISST